MATMRPDPPAAIGKVPTLGDAARLERGAVSLLHQTGLKIASAKMLPMPTARERTSPSGVGMGRTEKRRPPRSGWRSPGTRPRASPAVEESSPEGRSTPSCGRSGLEVGCQQIGKTRRCDTVPFGNVVDFVAGTMGLNAELSEDRVPSFAMAAWIASAYPLPSGRMSTAFT